MPSLVISIFLYACESWTQQAELEKRTQDFEMRCYRRLLKISLKDYATNEDKRRKYDKLLGLGGWGGGGQGVPNSQQAHDVVLTSMRRNDVASTSFRRHVPNRFLISQCQIITFLILKSDKIENSRIELKGIVLPVPSNQIKVSFIIILPFNLVYL